MYMKKKKLLGLAALAISSFGLMAGVNAEAEQAKKEFTNCLTSGEGETCTLTESISVDSRITITRSVAIDLGGKTITLSKGAFVLFNTAGDATISNGTVTQQENNAAIVAVNSGKVTIRNLNVSNNDSVENRIAAVQVGAPSGDTYLSGHLIVEDGTVIKGSRGISVFGAGSNLEIKGGEIETNAFAVSGNRRWQY